ncbi:CoA-disulfide reductase [Streptococcus bovimastitidis]|uniref:CoA-disulfide reductase n=1 Tax=Streptococcus bovimastitidis TaxID=1856638 RepID=A0A1L8MLP5_9STRE|nr:FAD-dependent oxidoreductase [Streptococcus bovimastitidis]OJF71605.1 CoA-disulfide reductase [Streptococcus bovimastitidis]
MKIIIIGGVAGGMSAATRLRRLIEDAEIIVFDKGPYVSFANCGLPFHVSGEIAEREALLVQTPERLKARFNLDVRPNSEVLAINPEEKTVTVSHEGKNYTENYDKLILSPGAKPFIPPIVGLEDAKNVYSLRNIPDLDQILAHISGQNLGKATVIGAGFIGLEMAESLAQKGYQVTIVEMAPQILPPLDQEMARFVENELLAKGITVITGRSAQAFSQEGKVINLTDGRTLESDLTIMSVGVSPASDIAKKAGVALGLKGGILVDDHYQTNLPDVYAVGDAIVVKQEITGKDALISLANPANRQGRQVADVIAGIERPNKGSIGTAIVRVFGLAAASTGLSERVARQEFDDVEVLHISGKDHASYFPGATDINLKLVFGKNSGRIYGAQAVGKKGVDKRIDILATAIKGDLTVFDLPELEFTYAPPFGSAKDPVNMAGYAAINLMEGTSRSIQHYQLEEALTAGKILLDVRTESEFSRGHFGNAINIPLDDLRSRIGELDAAKEFIVSCQSGLRSYIAERILKQNGFNVENLDGAYALYSTVYPERIEK